ncbi:WW domain-containing transcription regulator protein 1 [Corvus brachyrhynchos]|uniref:WW domain-containing transcription regulator protein 1 n=1 Tax=Corvus brachyrhynchos TaxID=85066 RepID=A0A091ESF1_CORBR|nr:WW domain-containing transcription regulator protein 1 [Corvus brachyrhynchos]
MNPAAAAPPPGQQVIHVTQDLDTELEALFNAVMNPRPSSWRKKILPESFFREPDSGSHSRQSSTDSGGPPLPPTLAAQRDREWGLWSVISPPLPPSSSTSYPSGAERQGMGIMVSSSSEASPTAQGQELYFVLSLYLFFLSHIEKITTWQDPRKPMNQPLNHVSHHPPAASTPQRSMATSQPNLIMNAQPQLPPNIALPQQSRPPQPPALLTLPSSLTTQQQQQKLRLQRIQMERERIRMRQEELLRQEAALCRQLPMDSENMVPVQTAVNTPAMTQDMRPVTNNGSDPFLNSGPYHSREQSTDSGLGLGCYSIPTTPEDFLSNVDEMDTGESITQTTMNINPQQTRFPDFLDCLPGTNVDLGTLESEDLIPILNDVESVLNKNEPFLTWL